MPTRYWLFLILTFALTGFIGYSTYSTARLLRTWRPPSNPLLMPAENLVRVGLILLCIGLGALSGLSPAQLGWLWPETQRRLVSQLVGGIGCGLGLALFFYVATRWVTARTGGRFYSDVVIAHITPANGGELALIGLVMIAVALLEELLFRSLLIGGLTPLVPAWALVVAVGLLFGVMHSPQGALGMVGAGLAGVIFGALLLWTGSLLLPLIAHYTANMAQMGMVMARGPFALPPSQTSP